ncbi:hypothetical protein KDD17_01265 [Sulfitobacter albidus]|uniref:Metal-dependent peptidase n=1 Tax=Sulfitobacter albidus TaxID=2829501 RepID=A0A975JEU5_9RHOB|nr:VWA-like domain-containing protein [Sulfitobacter albidus]QUJ76725.1 hypothetical protein KDD17_01265 [Sulfitobacter albidus]
MNDTHSIRAGPALRALAEADPALAALSLWCTHRDGARTMTAGARITYGPEFAALPLHEQIGLAGHHILHVALRHSARQAALAARLGAAFDADRFTLAADALVNEAVLAGDHALPRPAVTLSGLLSAVRGLEPGPAPLVNWDVERLYFALGAGSEGAQGREGDAQSYAQAQEFATDLEPDTGNPDSQGEIEDAARWRQHTARAMQAGRGAGRGIGRIGHSLADLPSPRIPWEHVLRRLVTAAVLQSPQPTPLRPARRWIATAAQARLAQTPTPGFEAGRRNRTDVPRIAIGLDASSSIPDAALGIFWAEVTGIARRSRAELHLMIFDDAIREQVRFDPSQTRLPLPTLPRGGGTAFSPVIAQAQALGAAALVLLTDLEGDPGPAPRGLRVIWATPAAPAREPSFGTLLDLGA